MDIPKREYMLGVEFGVRAPETCCLFCRNCSDVWWDYTNGPYMFNCIIDNDLTEKGCLGKCENFDECWDEIEKRNEEYKKQQEEICKQVKLCNEQWEKLNENTRQAIMKEISERFIEKMWEAILDGIPEDALTDPPDPMEIEKMEEDIDDE